MKKGILIAVVAMAVALLGACDMMWFGELEGKTFHDRYDVNGGIGENEETYVFDTETTGSFSMTEYGSLGEVTGETEFTFTYEWDFNTLTGTIIPDGDYSEKSFEIDDMVQPMELIVDNRRFPEVVEDEE